MRFSLKKFFFVIGLFQITSFGGSFDIESIIWIKDFKWRNKNYLEVYMEEKKHLQDGNFV